MDKVKRIIVSGPQRSGTTICAKMMASDHGWRYIDGVEKMYTKDHDLIDWFHGTSNIVMQCAGRSHILPLLASSNTLVIWMKRGLSEIHGSERRIGWNPRDEIAKYKSAGHLLTPGETIAELKQKVWDNHQKHLISLWREVEYSSLRKHSMWVPPYGRVDFKPKQTEAKY